MKKRATDCAAEKEWNTLRVSYEDATQRAAEEERGKGEAMRKLNTERTAIALI